MKKAFRPLHLWLLKQSVRPLSTLPMPPATSKTAKVMMKVAFMSIDTAGAVGLVLMPSSSKAPEVKNWHAGDATLKRGLDSLQRRWQSHAGPSNFIPALQSRPSGSASPGIMPNEDFEHSENIASPSSSSHSTASQEMSAPPQNGIGPPDNAPQESSQDQRNAAADKEASSASTSPHQVYMANATLDKNLQSLQRRWDSQRNRCAQDCGLHIQSRAPEAVLHDGAAFGLGCRILQHVDHHHRLTFRREMLTPRERQSV